MTKLAQLPPERTREVKQFPKRTRSPRERDRARAILKLTEGMPRKSVARFLDLHVKTLDRWQLAFRRLGTAGLQDKPQPGNRRLLTLEQKEKIKQLLAKHKPEDLGLPGKFWNVPLLRQLVRKEFGILYRSLTTYRKLFVSCGFSYHKPVKVNRKQNPHLRKRFEDVLKKRSDGTVEKITWYW